METIRTPSPIKSIQRGVNTLSGATSDNITISPVNMDKSVVHLSAMNSGSDGERIQLTSTDNLLIVSSGSGTHTFVWQVVEYV